MIINNEERRIKEKLELLKNEKFPILSLLKDVCDFVIYMNFDGNPIEDRQFKYCIQELKRKYYTELKKIVDGKIEKQKYVQKELYEETQ